jgi:alkylation response protein AidB-like acyl-CoA dehydrogenase
MDFTFTEEQQAMAQTLRHLLDDLCPAATLRGVYEGSDRGAEERWRQLAEFGCCGVLADAAHGGLALGPPDFVLLAEELGRAALPEPLMEQAGVALPVLTALAAQPAAAALLPEAAAGRARLAVVEPHSGLALLPPGATHWLDLAEGEVTLVASAQVEATACPSVDGARRLYRAQAPRAGAQLLAGGDRGRRLSALAFEHGALFSAAQSLGVCERLLQLAVAYAKERRQFGRPVGSYQALKHQLANVQLQLDFARPVVYAAAARVADPGTRTAAAVSHAKLAAGDAADLAARTAIQVHGAMGYSWEVDLHFYMKRAWALAGAWGDRSFHARRVQTLLSESAFALGPDLTFADSA